MGLIVNEKKTKYMIVSAAQKGRQTQNWKLGDKVYGRVSIYKCLGNVIYKEGRISECLKDRIQVGNRECAAKHHIIKCKIIKRSVKMQIYKTLIRPVVTFGSETWTLKKPDENLLRIFERIILRLIYGLIQEGDTWRIRNNEELNRSINVEGIVKFIKAQRIRRLENVQRMEVEAMPSKMMEGRRKGRPHLRRCCTRLESNEDKAVNGEDER